MSAPSAQKAAMLARIRGALGKSGPAPETARGGALPQQRIAVPVRARRAPAESVQDFRQRLADQKVIVETLAAPEQIPAAVVRALEAARLPLKIRLGAEPAFDKLPWAGVPALQRSKGAASPATAAALSHAIAGIAETGTLVLASGEDNPVTLTFLPDLHIVTVEERTIVGGLEDAFDVVRARFGQGRMPRTLNLVSGASRTGDIGGQLVMGAHGPRTLVVLVIRSQA